MKIYYAIVGGVVENKAPERMGAWGPQTIPELLKEKSLIDSEIRGVVSELISEGYELELYGGHVFNNEREVFEKSRIIQESDVIIIYPVGPNSMVIRALLGFSKPTVVFIRSGERYYTFAEIFDSRVMRMETDYVMLPYSDDVFIIYDDLEELKRALRGIYGVYKLRRAKILYIGVPYGWQGRFHEFRAFMRRIGSEIIFLDHDRAFEEAQEYLESREGREEIMRYIDEIERNASEIKMSKEGVELGIKQFIGLKYLAKKYGADVVTISGCMLYGASKWRATPCLAFSLLDDHGLLGVCEGDLSNLVAKTLLRYVANRPAVFANPSIPNKGSEAVFAHCTAPTKLLGYGSRGFKYSLETHFESDSPAAIKVFFEEGYKVTLLNLSFYLDKALIVLGESAGFTNYPICRSQIKIRFRDTREIYGKARGFHWSYVYGDYTRELEYAMKVLGIEYEVIRS
ncbi:MAG: hypothetical protein ACP5I7_02895 [Sulfolobales archaeon]